MQKSNQFIYFFKLAMFTMIGKVAIFKSLNIEAKEITPVLMLIVQSVFLGIFYGTFDIGAHTLFLKTYPEDMIPKAYIISGIIGIILTGTFSRFQSKIRFSKLAIYTLMSIAFLTVLMRLFFEVTEAKWTVFVLFLFLGPLNILGILAFWGTVGRIFNLRQGKRLFGIIDSGQVFGIIISSYAIPFILAYLHGTKNLLLISAISILFALLIELIITRKYNINESANNKKQNQENISEKSKVRLKDFVKDPYILYMALFVIFSMFAAFFVQFSFLVVTNEQYPLEDDLAKYLAFFTGSMMAFTFIIKTFVYSKLMKTYGLKVSLILSPLLLALFTGIAIVVGWISGFENGSPGFIYFFLFISLSKLFNKTLKDALEVPSFKLLYQSLKKTIRFDVQAKIDGTINEMAALTSGILLSVLGLLTFIKLIHFSVFLFVLLGLWTIITLRLYKQYRHSLEKSLTEKHSDTEKSTQINFNSSKSGKLDSGDLKKLNYAQQYLPQHFHALFLNFINAYNKIALSELPNNIFIEVIMAAHQNNLNPELKKNIESQLKIKPNKKLSTNELAEKLNTADNFKIAEAIYQLYALDNKQRLTQLWALLRTPVFKAQLFTVRLCGTMDEVETINTLVEFLDSDLLFAQALISLKQLANNHAPQIIQTFYKSDISLNSQLAILESISEAPIDKTFDFLIENLSHSRKEIFEKTIDILKQHDVNINEAYLPKLFHPITVASKTLSWDISALASLSSQTEKTLLHYVLEYEYIKHETVLMDLLAITYDRQSVNHVQDHLNAGTSEGIGYALELFDLFLSEEIKPMILALFEDMSLIDKSHLLETFFPVQISDEKTLILDIINRNPNLISNTTKQVALSMYLSYYQEITNDLIAQIFNPLPQIKTAAAHIISTINNHKYKQLKTRLTAQDRLVLENTMSKYNANHIIINYFYNNPALLKMLQLKNSKLLDLTDVINLSETQHLKKETINTIVNNYFVFLDSDQVSANTNKHKKSTYISGIHKTDLLMDKKFILGIEKSKMNKITLLQSDFVQNIINTL